MYTLDVQTWIERADIANPLIALCGQETVPEEADKDSIEVHLFVEY
jgi:hypothetical protein